MEYGKRQADKWDHLIDRAEINEVLVAYCQGVDRREWDRVLQCYHADATDTHGEFRGSPRELIEWMRPNHEHVRFCMHTLSNVSIRFAERPPGLARVESYCISRKLIEAAEKDPYLRDSGLSGPLGRTVACRYVDTFEHRPGVGWRILDRVVVHEWMRRDSPEDLIPFAEGIALSTRDRTDPLFLPLDHGRSGPTDGSGESTHHRGDTP